jgi:hypothetical protein
VSTEPGDNESGEIMQRVAAKALDDEDFRDRLIRKPKPELAASGLQLPDDVEVEVLENTPTKLHLVLPSRRQPDGKLDPKKKQGFHLLNRWPV